MIEFIFGILSMLIAGLSILLMKKGLNITTVRDSLSPFFPVKMFLKLFKNKYWFCGGVFLILSWGFRIVATSIADLSYVRMLYVPHLLIVVVGSYWFLKERIPRSVVISSIMMVAGLIFLAISPPLTRNPQASLSLLYSFILVLSLVSLGFFFISIKFKKSRNFFFGICAAFFLVTACLHKDSFRPIFSI